MTTKLKGSGGHINADVTDEQSKKADLGVGELFLAPVGRIEQDKISSYYCKKCDAEFANAPKLEFENPNEQVAEGMTLQEIGKYLCTKCNSKIGEYRTFSKN
jgi:DNA-directed RNA polymerase subunit RPC12/RpoP